MGQLEGTDCVRAQTPDAKLVVAQPRLFTGCVETQTQDARRQTKGEQRGGLHRLGAIEERGLD